MEVKDLIRAYSNILIEKEYFLAKNRYEDIIDDSNLLCEIRILKIFIKDLKNIK
jgi:hypothetical protein